MSERRAEVGAQVKQGPYGDLKQADDAGYLDFDFFALLRTLRKRLGVIVGITLGLTCLALVAVFQMTPLYTAETLILLDQQKTQVIDVESVMSGLGGDSATIDSQVEILKSRSVARRVVEDLLLTEDPEFNSDLKPTSILNWIDPRAWVAYFLSNATSAETDQSKLPEANH